MNHQTIRIAVFSTDRTLINTIQCGNTSDIKVKYSYRECADSVYELSDYDGLVYDLSLSSNDLANAKDQMLRIKELACDKPLFLVGEQYDIENAMILENIEPHIHRAITKPLMRNELSLHLGLTVLRASSHSYEPLAEIKKEKIRSTICHKHATNESSRNSSEITQSDAIETNEVAFLKSGKPSVSIEEFLSQVIKH